MRGDGQGIHWQASRNFLGGLHEGMLSDVLEGRTSGRIGQQDLFNEVFCLQ